MDDLELYMPKVFVNEITNLLDPKTYTIKDIAEIAETNDANVYKKLYTKFEQYINDLNEQTNKQIKRIDDITKKTIFFENWDEAEKERLYKDFHENQFSILDFAPWCKVEFNGLSGKRRLVRDVALGVIPFYQEEFYTSYDYAISTSEAFTKLYQSSMQTTAHLDVQNLLSDKNEKFRDEEKSKLYSHQQSEELDSLIKLKLTERYHIFEKLKYPTLFLNVQETVLYCPQIKKTLNMYDQESYNRIALFNNTKKFDEANDKDYYDSVNFNKNNISTIDVTTSSTIDLYARRYDSAIIKSQWDMLGIKNPLPFKNVLFEIFEPKLSHNKMEPFRYKNKVTLHISNIGKGNTKNNEFHGAFSDSILKELQEQLQGIDKVIQMTQLMIPTSFVDKDISMLIVVSDLAENSRFYNMGVRKDVLGILNITSYSKLNWNKWFLYIQSIRK